MKLNGIIGIPLSQKKGLIFDRLLGLSPMKLIVNRGPTRPPDPTPKS
jgi:hypothetical protein